MARYAELRNFKLYMGTNKTLSHVANFKHKGFSIGKVKASECVWTKLVLREDLSGFAELTHQNLLMLHVDCNGLCQV